MVVDQKYVVVGFAQQRIDLFGDGYRIDGEGPSPRCTGPSNGAIDVRPHRRLGIAIVREDTDVVGQRQKDGIAKQRSRLRIGSSLPIVHANGDDMAGGSADAFRPLTDGRGADSSASAAVLAVVVEIHAAAAAIDQGLLAQRNAVVAPADRGTHRRRIAAASPALATIGRCIVGRDASVGPSGASLAARACR